MSDNKPMTASEICYRYSSVLEDSIRDRLWGERDSLRGQVKAIMESHGLLEQWENHADLHGCRSSDHSETADFVDQHFSGAPSAREALLSRCAEIERLTKEWQDFYYGLKNEIARN